MVGGLLKGHAMLSSCREPQTAGADRANHVLSLADDLTGTWAATKTTCSYRQTSGCHPAWTEGRDDRVDMPHGLGVRPQPRTARNLCVRCVDS